MKAANVVKTWKKRLGKIIGKLLEIRLPAVNYDNGGKIAFVRRESEKQRKFDRGESRSLRGMKDLRNFHPCVRPLPRKKKLKVGNFSQQERIKTETTF